MLSQSVLSVFCAAAVALSASAAQAASRDFSIADFGAEEGVKATGAFAGAMTACEAAVGPWRVTFAGGREFSVRISVEAH